MQNTTTTRRYTFDRFSLEVAEALNLSTNDLLILADLIDLRDAGGESIQVDGQVYVWCHVPSRIERLPILARADGRKLAPRTVEDNYRKAVRRMEKAGVLSRQIERSKRFNGAAIRGTYLYIQIDPVTEALLAKREPLSDEEKARLVPTGQDSPLAPATDHCVHTRTDTDHYADTRNDIDQYADTRTGVASPHAKMGTSRHANKEAIRRERLPSGSLSEGVLLGSSTGEGIVSCDTPPTLSDEGKDMEIPPSSLPLIIQTSPVLVPDPVVPPQYPVASVRPPRPQDYTDEGDRPIRRQMISRSMMSSMIETHVGYDYLSCPLQPPDYLRYECVVFAMAKKYGVITGDNWAKDKAVFEAWFYRVGPQWLDQPRDRARLVEALEVAYEQGIPADRLGEAVKGVPVVTDEEILQRLIHGGSWGMRSDTISLTYMVELWTGVPLPDDLREALLNTTECFQTSLSGHIIADSERGRLILSMAEFLCYPMYREIKPGDLPRPARKQTRDEDYEDLDEQEYRGCSDID